MRAYEEALAGQPLLIGSERVKPGTIRALAVSYYNSVAFRSMKPSTQSVYRNIIDRFCRETDKEGHRARGQAGRNTTARARRQTDGRARPEARQRKWIAQGRARDDEACCRDRFAR